jgi:hypothetical protein
MSEHRTTPSDERSGTSTRITGDSPWKRPNLRPGPQDKSGPSHSRHPDYRFRHRHDHGRFCLLRPTPAYIDRLRELKEVDADQFAVYLMHDEEQKTLAAYATRSSRRFPEVRCGYAVRHDT